MARLLRVGGAVAAAAAAGWLVLPSERREGISRFTYSAAVGASIIWDYKVTAGRAKDKFGEKSDEYKAVRAGVDLDAARKILGVCRKHGGLYIKLAQTMSVNNMSLPREYTDTLAAAQDKATARPWAEVARVFEEDTGRPASEVFAAIGETPIAAASLAQVHRAVTHDGQVVAVKIQYPHLRQQVASDMAAMHFFVNVIEALFPDYGYSWLLPEFEASIANELNFMQEAHNGERVAAMFAGERRVHIPAVRRDLTTPRVLVMEFITGSKVTDGAALAALGVAPLDLAEVVTTFFADQIYVHGFVHCDPHPGNLMVRRHPGTGAWQLVVLDHGMYRRLTPQFRAAYARLWRALVTRDLAGGERATIELGLDRSAFDALSLALTYRSASSGAGLGSRMSKADIDRLKADYKEIKAGDVNRFMQRLPRDMIFVMRNTNLVRSLNLELGGTSRQRFRVMGMAAIKGLAVTDAVADFSAASAAHLAVAGATPPRVGHPPRQGDATALVADVPAASGGGATASPGTAEGEAAAGSVAAVLAAAGRAWSAIAHREAPPREPQTYLNALSAGAILTEPTDSERQRDMTLSWRRQAAVAWETARLSTILWWLDAAFALSTWLGWFTPHDGEHHAHKEPG